MGQMKRLDNILDNMDLIREDIAELDLDRAIRRMADLLAELVSINSGVARGEPVESATTFTKSCTQRTISQCLKGYAQQEMLDRHGFGS